MTNQELNRDIKRLFVKYTNKHTSNDTSNWTQKEWDNYEVKENEFKAEFNRLYRADSEFTNLNKNSVTMLVILNRKLRTIPFHVFGPTEFKI